MKFYDPARLKYLVALVVAGAVLIPAASWGINTVATGYQTTTSEVSVDAHSDCQKLSHTGSTSYFVPTKTSAEWTAFQNNKPSDVTVGDCQSWYVADVNSLSCDAVCSAAGKIASANVHGSTCASGENRPVGESANIAYPYGGWGPEADRVNAMSRDTSCWGGGKDNQQPTCTTHSHCWYPGQPRDWDGTDILVACHCS